MHLRSSKQAALQDTARCSRVPVTTTAANCMACIAIMYLIRLLMCRLSSSAPAAVCWRPWPGRPPGPGTAWSQASDGPCPAAEQGCAALASQQGWLQAVRPGRSHRWQPEVPGSADPRRRLPPGKQLFVQDSSRLPSKPDYSPVSLRMMLQSVLSL